MAFRLSSKGGKTGHRLDVASVRAWLDDLPKLDRAAFGREILHCLETLRASDLETPERFQILEILCQETVTLLDDYCRECEGAHFPLKSEIRAVYEEMQTLLQALEKAYLDIAEESWPRAERLDQVRDRLRRTVFQSISLLGQRITLAYGLYRPPPTGTWIRLHQIYHRAELTGMDRERVEPLSDWSVGAAYLRVVLTALANPFALMLGEIQQVYDWLGKWALAIHVTHPNELSSRELEEALARHYVIDLGQDTPGEFAPGRPAGEYDLQDLRILRLDALLEIVENRIRELTLADDPGFGTWQERDLLRRLRNAWRSRAARSTGRMALDGHTRILSGLPAIHFQFDEGREFAPEQDEVSLHGENFEQHQGLSLVPLDQETWREDETRQKLAEGIIKPRSYLFDVENKEEDIWKKATLISASGKSSLESWVEHRTTSTRSELALRDESAGGFRLACAADSGLRLRVGSLLLIDRCQDRQPRLATVRWLITSGDETLELGAGFIEGTPDAAAVRGLEGKGAGSQYQRALLLELDGGQACLVPAGLFAPASLVLVNRRSALSTLRFKRIRYSTKSITCFDTEPVELDSALQQKVISSLYRLLNDAD